ncbi:HalOD1 output domain-containing protein [Halomarina ordinaria]|uniref:HalOD1 output domain-containing protein n=1 Tax=Halomarina ordinaria TaxID=3033939 RepID=A0ABD5U8D4_9EURY|nr:HalOD1 output domain-containing protein [Halomarina sp. PSRA2]
MFDSTTSVVEAVAKELAVDPTSLPPLYETVDPDALDSLATTGITVRFTHAGCDVHIEDGIVTTETRAGSYTERGVSATD